MDQEIKEKYIKAGKIARDVLEASRDYIKPNMRLLDIAEWVESETRKRGGEPAFPLNLSLNDVAAHYTPIMNDTLVFTKDDIMKVDLGVHIDGYVADTAYTITFNPALKKLEEASRKALDAAMELVKPGVKVSKIGEIIEETIKSFGYVPISNLTGHGLDQYIVHTAPTIPNVNNRTSVVLEEGMAIAIEPFATDGAGLIKESEPAVIMGMNQRGAVRNPDARIIMDFLQSRLTLPFAERWLPVPSLFKARMALRELRSRGIVYDYPPLKEVRGGFVAQSEHTLIVEEVPIITT